MDLKALVVREWSGFIWLMTEPSGGLVRTIAFRKRRSFVESLGNSSDVSFRSSDSATRAVLSSMRCRAVWPHSRLLKVNLVPRCTVAM
jgi:hypothetical protein